MKKQKNFSLGSYLKKHKGAIALYVFVTMIGSLLTLATTVISANAVELITKKEYSKAILYFCFVIGVMLIQRISWYLSGVLYDVKSVAIMADLNQDLAKQSFKLNSKTYSDHGTGDFVQRIVSDPERVIGACADIVDMVLDVITAILITSYIIYLSPLIGIFVVATFIIGFVLESQRVKVRRKLQKEVKSSYDKINSLTTEIVRSEKDIKSLGLEEKLSEVSKENYAKYKIAARKSQLIDRTFYSSRNTILEIAAIIALIIGVSLMDKGLTMAAFMVIYSHSGSFSYVVWNIGHIADRFVEISISKERMASLFDEDEYVTERFGKTRLKNIKGDIEFKNVNFTFKEYERIKENKKKKTKKETKLVGQTKVFENLSFEIKRNTTVAFVGKSGSGKSTILNLMSKMYEVDDGEVLIDGVNINDLDKKSLREGISLVNQFPYIFDMTIKENLLLAKKDATTREINLAIKKASLKDFIDSLPNGINTKVGESGIKLSGGQKQRLAIARALLRKSNIIIFDESTSSLDNFAQEDVKRSIDGLKGKSTIVIVAHRLSTIKDADVIFFLDEGNIVDQGTFEELFKRNKMFKAMFLAENI